VRSARCSMAFAALRVDRAGLLGGRSAAPAERFRLPDGTTFGSSPRPRRRSAGRANPAASRPTARGFSACTPRRGVDLGGAAFRVPRTRSSGRSSPKPGRPRRSRREERLSLAQRGRSIRSTLSGRPTAGDAHAGRVVISGHEALARLREGNCRFVSGVDDPDATLKQTRRPRATP